MSENRLYVVPVVVALLVLGSLTAWQVVTSAEVVSEAAGAVAGGYENRVGSASQDTIPLAECFDVSLSELAGCRSAGQSATESGEETAGTRPLPPDECFDVPLGEICDK
jgi:hypothetical protein